MMPSLFDYFWWHLTIVEESREIKEVKIVSIFPNDQKLSWMDGKAVVVEVGLNRSSQIMRTVGNKWIWPKRRARYPFYYIVE